jgi:hypothetical protein
MDKILKMCGSKRRLTEKKAKNVANTMTSQHKMAVDAYECPYCHYWHVGRNKGVDTECQKE